MTSKGSLSTEKSYMQNDFIELNQDASKTNTVTDFQKMKSQKRIKNTEIRFTVSSAMRLLKNE